jgi:hypothetical protein
MIETIDALKETEGGSATQNYLPITLKEYGGEVICRSI